MAKRKSGRGPALFDLLDQDAPEGSEALKVPRWWARDAKPARPVGGPKADEVAGRHVLDPAAGEGIPLSSGRAAFIELDGDRIRISFTSVTAAVAVFAAVGVVLGALELGRSRGKQAGLEGGYVAGRASYSAEAVSEIEQAREQPPATHLLSSLLKESETITPPADTATDESVTDSGQRTWIRDYTYIVAQEFSADHHSSGLRAQEFLTRNGVATELVRYPSGAIQLITTQGYNIKDPAQRRLADQLRNKIRDIGAEYYAAGGGYKLEGYFKTLKGDTW